MTSQTGQQIITYTYYLIPSEAKAIRQWNLVRNCNIAWEVFFLKFHEENELGRLVWDLFLFFEKASYEVKASS